MPCFFVHLAPAEDYVVFLQNLLDRCTCFQVGQNGEDSWYLDGKQALQLRFLYIQLWHAIPIEA